MRFRHYLGSNYVRAEEIDGVKVPLPLLPIYILGFPLSIDNAVLKINRQYKDVRTGEILTVKDEFVENLSHDCFVIQIRSLPPKAQTKLEKLLSFFDQKFIFDKEQKWLLKYQEAIDAEDQRLIFNRLAFAAESEEVKEQIEIEETFDDSMDRALREMESVVARKEELINQKEELINQKEEVINQKEEVINQKEEVINQKEEVISQKEEVISQKEEELSKAKEFLEKEKQEKEALLQRLAELEKQMKG